MHSAIRVFVSLKSVTDVNHVLSEKYHTGHMHKMPDPTEREKQKITYYVFVKGSKAPSVGAWSFLSMEAVSPSLFAGVRLCRRALAQGLPDLGREA